MAQDWKKFKMQMKEKRQGKKIDKDSREEIVVQRLSATVSGKAQKYTRVGPREFVEFGDQDMTIENLKQACLKHFRPKIGENMLCDILAGEQGPSCTNIKQIPNVKLIHVRFIEGDDDSIVEIKCEDEDRQFKKRKHHSTAVSMPSPKKKEKDKSLKPVPKSLSVSTILKLGRVIEATNVTVVDLFTFNLEAMSWSNLPTSVEFVISREMLGEGGFRKAFKAKSTTRGFTHCEWVVKRYKESAIKEIKETNQTVEDHTKKVVQMHHLAKNFASRLESEVEKQDLREEFGQLMHYKNIFLGKISDGEVVSVEEFVKGDLVKYVNNDGKLCENSDESAQKKAECLVHFSYEDSNHEVMLVDVQGVGYSLFDPEIASTELIGNNDELLFTTGNLSKEAIENFMKEHFCNSFCQYLNLKELK